MAYPINIRIYSIATYLLTFMVIVWGAFVRVTHSGAGCGKHWPLCNGEFIPFQPEIETIIELTHRTTSGLSFIFVLILFYISKKSFSKGSLLRSAASYALFFMLIEVAIGASLVLFGWVKDNTSEVRAFMIAFHLVNSFLLMASLAIHAFVPERFSDIQLKNLLILIGNPVEKGMLFFYLIVGSTGAITALGDTLFPVINLRAQNAGYNVFTEITSASHFLIQLRIIHPILAIILALVLIQYVVFNRLDGKVLSNLNFSSIRKLSFLLVVFTLTQTIIGPLTILFQAPASMQLLHLSCSLILWTTLVLLILNKEFSLR
jgi:heme A synthase